MTMLMLLMLIMLKKLLLMMVVVMMMVACPLRCSRCGSACQCPSRHSGRRRKCRLCRCRVQASRHATRSGDTAEQAAHSGTRCKRRRDARTSPGLTGLTLRLAVRSNSAPRGSAAPRQAPCPWGGRLRQRIPYANQPALALWRVPHNPGFPSAAMSAAIPGCAIFKALASCRLAPRRHRAIVTARRARRLRAAAIASTGPRACSTARPGLGLLRLGPCCDRQRQCSIPLRAYGELKRFVPAVAQAQ